MIVCADDFAISSRTSEGILLLLERGRVSATSCIVTTTNAHNDLQRLITFHDKVDTGLHLVLPKPNERNRFYSLRELVTMTCTGRLNQQKIKQEFYRQLAMFRLAVGRSPDFFDGHQHIHQLPFVRDAFVEFLSEVRGHFDFYVRLSSPPVRGPVTLGLRATSVKVRSALTALGIPFSKRLFGYHRYNARDGFRQMIQRLGKFTIEKNDILYTHPGLLDKELRSIDSLIESRQSVLDFMMSDEYDFSFKSRGIAINRFVRDSERVRQPIDGVDHQNTLSFS